MLNLLIKDDDIESDKKKFNIGLYNNEGRLIKTTNNINEILEYIKTYKIDLIIINECEQVKEKSEIFEIVKNDFKNLSEKIYEEKIYKELLNIKYSLKHNGTKYIMESILYVVSNNFDELLLNNLEKNVYRVVAQKYGKSVENIKNNIVKATNNMYSECSIDYLMKYFKYEYDKKPTPKMVIATIVNKLNLEKTNNNVIDNYLKTC